MTASVVGNGLEWFDFLSYAYFASSIGQEFFPLGDPVASLLLTFGVFAAGVHVRYVVANSWSYLYFSNERPTRAGERLPEGR